MNRDEMQRFCDGGMEPVLNDDSDGPFLCPKCLKPFLKKELKTVPHGIVLRIPTHKLE